MNMEKLTSKEAEKFNKRPKRIILVVQVIGGDKNGVMCDVSGLHSLVEYVFQREGPLVAKEILEDTICVITENLTEYKQEIIVELDKAYEKMVALVNETKTASDNEGNN